MGDQHCLVVETGVQRADAQRVDETLGRDLDPAGCCAAAMESDDAARRHVVQPEGARPGMTAFVVAVQGDAAVPPQGNIADEIIGGVRPIEQLDEGKAVRPGSAGRRIERELAMDRQVVG